MRELATIEDLEGTVGKRPRSMMMKAVHVLDEGCELVLRNAPLAGFGFRDDAGDGWATVLGGQAGFVRMLSPTQVRFDLPVGRARPVAGGSVALVLLLPGIGETLRFTGVVTDRDDGTLTVDLREAWVHCAKCIHRSGLWGAPVPEAVHGSPALPDGFDPDSSPFGSPEALGILSASPFAFITSWDASGACDTSPRGDRPGFLRLLDDRTLAIPDRKGNRRTDTFHNLLECDDVALAALVPGRSDILHVRGHAFITDDAPLLGAMALNERPPHAALVMRVDAAVVLDDDGIRAGRMWDAESHVDPAAVPDLMALGAAHLAKSRATGAQATATRMVSKGLARNAKFLRKGVDHGYRKELKEEGF
jgi:predicted pyridoxine 5'-phosphate oxidase superfamily flavin-nucleotide-binding protein